MAHRAVPTPARLPNPPVRRSWWVDLVQWLPSMASSVVSSRRGATGWLGISVDVLGRGPLRSSGKVGWTGRLQKTQTRRCRRAVSNRFATWKLTHRNLGLSNQLSGTSPTIGPSSARASAVSLARSSRSSDVCLWHAHYVNGCFCTFSDGFWHRRVNRRHAAPLTEDLRDRWFAGHPNTRNRGSGSGFRRMPGSQCGPTGQTVSVRHCVGGRLEFQKRSQTPALTVVRRANRAPSGYRAACDVATAAGRSSARSATVRRGKRAPTGNIGTSWVSTRRAARSSSCWSVHRGNLAPMGAIRGSTRTDLGEDGCAGRSSSRRSSCDSWCG